jgi:hypothetical protein
MDSVRIGKVLPIKGRFIVPSVVQGLAGKLRRLHCVSAAKSMWVRPRPKIHARRRTLFSPYCNERMFLASVRLG